MKKTERQLCKAGTVAQPSRPQRRQAALFFLSSLSARWAWAGGGQHGWTSQTPVRRHQYQEERRVATGKLAFLLRSGRATLVKRASRRHGSRRHLTAGLRRRRRTLVSLFFCVSNSRRLEENIKKGKDLTYLTINLQRGRRARAVSTEKLSCRYQKNRQREAYLMKQRLKRDDRWEQRKKSHDPQ